MNLNLPEVAVSDRISVVQRVKTNERTTLANLEGPGCLRHIWGTAGRKKITEKCIENRISCIR